MNNSLNILVHTVVQGGPIGPQKKEPLLVLDYADPVGWHAVIRMKLLGPADPKVEEPLALLALIHADPTSQRATIHRTVSLRECLPAQPAPTDGAGLVEVNSDKELTARQVPDSTLDSQLMEGITYTEVSLDSRPMEGVSCQEQVQQSILLASWIVSPRDCVMEMTLYCEPVIIPAINHNLDSRPMEGTTYLEHSAPAVYLDSWPMEGEVRMKKSEWEPVIPPADRHTPDSRHMEGMTYLEHPAPAVYLDSWLVRGASYPRPHVNWEVVNSKPSVNNVTIVKMVDIDASDDVNTQLPENTPPMLDQNMSRKYSPEYVTPVSTPMTALAWPCVDSPQLPMVKHELVSQRKDTREIELTLPENTSTMIDPNMSRKYSPEYVTPVSTPMTALAWSCVDLPQLPTVKHEFVNRRKDTREIELTLPENTPPMIVPNMSRKYLPEYVTPVSTAMTALAWSCVDSPRLPKVKHEFVNRRKDTREIELTLPENTPPMIDPNMSRKYSPEYVTLVSTPMTALAWSCVDSPQLPTVKHEFVNRRRDTREI